MARLAFGLLMTIALPAAAQLPPALAPATRSHVGPVETEMRNVHYHAAPRVVLRIGYLRGALLPTDPNAPPWFEDASSFTLSIDSADVTINAASLTALLNDHVFRYDGSPLRHLEVSIVGNGLELRGRLHKGITLPFSMRASLSVTADGRLKLHPERVRVAGIGVRGLMETFSIELDDMVKVRGGRGVTVQDNDFYLSPAELMPPPRIRGRLRALRIEGDALVQTLVDPSRRGAARPLGHGTMPANYMYYRGNILRFGKLTMNEADLLIVDADPRDPFDFFLAHLNEQLVAGATRNEMDFGLVTAWPDYNDLPARQARPVRNR